MKCINIRIFSWVMMFVVLSSCLPSTPNATEEPILHPSRGLIIHSSGSVRLSRDGWRSGQWVPVATGTLVSPTDLLDVSGSATILCPDLTLHEVTDHSPCPDTRKPGLFEYRGTTYQSTARAVSDTIPYILYPRNTLVLDDRPLLQWHEAMASPYTYTVSIWSDEGGNRNITTTNITTFRYPADSEALRPNISYLLIVSYIASNGVLISSEDDSSVGLGFELIGTEQRKEIKEQRDRILEIDGLGSASKKLALAVYYASHDWEHNRGIWGDTWLLLEEVAPIYNTPAVHVLRGDMAWNMKLLNEAEAAYQTALQLAIELGDIESQASALTGLWCITQDQENLDEANQLYDTLGHQHQARCK